MPVRGRSNKRSANSYRIHTLQLAEREIESLNRWGEFSSVTEMHLPMVSGSRYPASCNMSAIVISRCGNPLGALGTADVPPPPTHGPRNRSVINPQRDAEQNRRRRVTSV